MSCSYKIRMASLESEIIMAVGLHSFDSPYVIIFFIHPVYIIHFHLFSMCSPFSLGKIDRLNFYIFAILPAKSMFGHLILYRLILQTYVIKQLMYV